MARFQTQEHKRIADSEARKADWKNWGPYLSERSWGTVREDYSANGDVWGYFTHDQARSRVYRWNEDGIAGVCNRFQNICIAVALWNERDTILKERLFGLSNQEGNHGEDVKEYYYYLDNTPTHSYMKMLYKYPQRAFPYSDLVETNGRRDKSQQEYELIDTGVFEENRYFDVFIEYAKADEEDILCRITAVNRGPDSAPIHILPHLWFRNTWSWGHNPTRPELSAVEANTVSVKHRHIDDSWWYVEGNEPVLLFTDNDTNSERLSGVPNTSDYVKDGINDAVVHKRTHRVNPERKGTKVAAHYKTVVAPGETFTVRTRFSIGKKDKPFDDFDDVFEQKIKKADECYAAVQKLALSEDEKLVQRLAFAGLLWTKQFYHYSVELWLDGDPASSPSPSSRKRGRNSDWTHLYNLDVISMPDKWEYPWYAAWDLAFHCIPIAMIDQEWAKRQLILMTREWYMHPNGQIPAYEWDFSNVNPPVHAWAALKVYEIARSQSDGKGDTLFLESIFHKLLLNFTWWVNRKDMKGNNIFQGGFLGLDNIGVFDRDAPLPDGAYLGQADGTAWMAMYCLNMMAIALELARTKPAYEDTATKFFEHFVWIARAMDSMDDGRASLWNEPDGFFYDSLYTPNGDPVPLKLRSFVGLIPLFAVQTIEPDNFEFLPRFKRRVDWFIRYRPQVIKSISSLTEPGDKNRLLLSIVDREKLRRILTRMLDETEFLSDYGLRSMSKYYEREPYTFQTSDNRFAVRYEPAESTSNMFGGNSNWRGPIWFPLNYLMIESLQKYHKYYGDSFKVEMPSGSNNWVTLEQAATEISRRLMRIFLRDESNDGRRAALGDSDYFQRDPQWRDYIPFHEYFHGDNGAGIGASHQTGWTALIAELIQQCGGHDD